MPPSPPPDDAAIPVAEILPDAAPAPADKRQFPCKQCGAKLDFSPGTATLKCPYCGCENEIPEVAGHVEELDFRAYLEKAAEEHATEELVRVKCDTCGAETTMPPHATAGQCPFCGTNLVFAGKSSRLIKPGSLLPFRVTQQQALDDFRSWIKALWFAPSDLKQHAEADHKLAGVYLPYWTYNCDTASQYCGERGDDYWETETYSEYENGKWVTKTREVQRTRWSSVSGRVCNRFADLLIPASRSLPPDYSAKLPPWDLQQLVAYADEYLSGFRAESYQVDLADGFVEAQGVMKGQIEHSICRDIGGDHQRISGVKTRYDNITFKHLLLPVWLSAYRFRDKLYRTMINARTGKVHGERPYSAMKITMLVVAIVAAVVAVGAIISQMH